MDCIKNIGCYPSCNAIRFPYPALETGVHLVVFDWLGTKKAVPFLCNKGDCMYIPNQFNDNSDVVFTIKQPSGNYYYWTELIDYGIAPDADGDEDECKITNHFFAKIRDRGGLECNI